MTQPSTKVPDVRHGLYGPYLAATHYTRFRLLVCRECRTMKMSNTRRIDFHFNGKLPPYSEYCQCWLVNIEWEVKIMERSVWRPGHDYRGLVSGNVANRAAHWVFICPEEPEEEWDIV